MADPNLVGYAVSVADQYGIPENVFLNQLNQESGFNQYGSNGSILTSSAGALGVAQILPTTAASPGYGVSAVDPSDPYGSIQFAGAYDAAMLKRTGSITGMLEGYNAGLGHLSAGAPYASAILGSSFADGVSPSASTSAPTAPNIGSGSVGIPNLIDGAKLWFTDPAAAWNAFINGTNTAAAGASAVVSQVTGQTTNGVTPAQGQAAIAATASNATAGAISGLFGSVFSTKTGLPIAVAVLGLILILGALFWLASSGKATQYIQAANGAVPA